jgi:integrase
MAGSDRGDPRTHGDRRMYLYLDYSKKGALYWYVKVARKGRRINLSEGYGTSAFDVAYEAAVAALGGVLRMRRVQADVMPDQPERRYLYADLSQRGQLRYYVQLRKGLPKIRIRDDIGSRPFNDAVDAAIAAQIAEYGTAGDYRHAQKQRSEPRPAVRTSAPQPATLRWYWTLYKNSDQWRGDLRVGHKGLSDGTREQRTGLLESLLADNGEKPFAILSRKVIKAEMKARTPVQAGNLLSALRGLIRWMIDEDHLDEDDDPTIGLKSGKARASRESGGWIPWTDEDLAAYRNRWPLGTEARLMLDILTYTMLRVGDASRFGPPHLTKMIKQMAFQIATEKSQGRTIVTVPIHPEFAASLRAARAAGMIGEEVFVGKRIGGDNSPIVPMTKKSWANKFKKYAVLAGVNEPKKSCHGVRKTRAEAAAYADCTEAQMMAMFGWTDPKMPAHYIAKAKRDKLGASGMEKLVSFDGDQNANIGDFLPLRTQNATVTPISNFQKKA